MRGSGNKFARKQEQAISALLVEPSIDKAAVAAGVSPASLWRWLQQPEFDAAYRRARRNALAQAIAQLQQSSGAAVNALRDIAEDKQATSSSRVSAARAVLEIGLRSIELEDLDNRLSALEKAAAEKAGFKGAKVLEMGGTDTRLRTAEKAGKAL